MSAKTEQVGVEIGSSFITAPLSAIRPDKAQPRRHFDEEAMIGLCDSMSLIGLINPIGITRVTASRWDIIYGERRWRAARRLGWKTIAARVFEPNASPARRLVLRMSENAGRADLSLLESFDAVDQLLQMNASSRLIAQVMCRPVAWVDNLIEITRSPLARALYESDIMTQVETWSLFNRISKPLRSSLLRSGEPISMQRCKKALAAAEAQARA